MIKETLVNALSEQMVYEYYSAYLYFAMSAEAERKGFKGFANWLNIQAQEEQAHGTHIYQYILQRGAVPKFADIKKPVFKGESAVGLMKEALEHELTVTERVNKIGALALKENDHALYIFMQWYINEQVEEENNLETIIQKAGILGDSNLYVLDAELMTRVFVDPFAAAGKAQP